MVPDTLLLLKVSFPLSGSVTSSMGGTEAAYATLHDQLCLLVQNCLKMKKKIKKNKKKIKKKTH